MTDIDGDLARLATHLDWPETPAIARNMEHSIVPPQKRHRRLPLVATLTAAALALVVLAVPAARERVTAFFGLGAVTIEQGTPTDLIDAAPGTPVDPSSVDVALPVALGTPDAAFRDAAGRLWIVYEAADGRPDALLTVFETAVEGGLTKLLADPSIQAEQVEVDGTPAYWVTGDDHFILFESPAGEVVEERGRRSAPALIWLREEVTYRLESDLDKAGAIEIAESMP